MAHKIINTYRNIPADQLPQIARLGEPAGPMTDDELLNLGIKRIAGDLYSCREQHAGGLDDQGKRTFAPIGDPLPGTVLSSGSLRDRHAQLPADVRPHILQSVVIRSTDPASDVRSAAAANLSDARAQIADSVGPMDDMPDLAAATDPDSASAILAEAQRMADNPTLPAERARICMADVITGHVVESEHLYPHCWAGETPR